jgi:cation:H+ antiporter
MDILIIVGQLVGGALGLHFGANWLVSGSSRLALTFGIKPLVIGLTVVAFGTSAPELTVSVAGAIDGKGDIAVGNVVGSNIANIGLILGVAAILRPMPVDADVFRRDFPAMLIAALAIATLPFIGGAVDNGESVGFMLDRWKGALLVLGLLLFIWLTLRGAKTPSGEPAKPVAETPADEADKPKPTSRLLLVGLTLLGLAVLVVGGKLFVDGAVSVAQKIGVPELVIGLTVVAVGTSLPELATSIVATLKKESEIGLGNVVGSNVFNIFCVLGLVSLIQPVMIDAQIMRMDMIVMLVFSIMAVVFAKTSRVLGRREGVILLVAYGLYVANLFVGWV